MPDENKKHRFHGCYVATLTPFDSNDILDEGVIRAHAQWLIESGVEGLCPAGTTGEFLYLTEQEKQRVVTTTVEAANGRVPVIAGIWALRLPEVERLARAAEDAGAQGVFLPPPIYYPASDREVFDWYDTVHKATNLPVFAYNIPQYAANTVSIDCLRRLFDAGALAGAKDSTGKTDRVSELVTQFGKEYVVFAASDGFASEGRKIGADGFISAIANATPPLFVRLWNGEDALQPQVDALRTTLKQVGSIPALKYLLTRQGFAFGTSRQPCTALSESSRKLLDAIELPRT